LVPIGLDPPFASPSTADFVAEAVRWRGSRSYLDPRLETYQPVIWNNLIRFAIPDGRSSTYFIAECPTDPSDSTRAILNHVAFHEHMSFNKFHDADLIHPAWKLLQYFDIPMSSRTSDALFKNAWQTTRQPTEATVRVSVERLQEVWEATLARER